jgi:hypothetical protein
MNIAVRSNPDDHFDQDPLGDLNGGQRDSVEDFLQFLLSTDKEYALTGPGGTGKTFALDKMLTTGIDLYEKSTSLLGRNTAYFTQALTATTNKATEVLRQATGRPAKTIHSFLGLKIKTDYRSGVKSLIKTNLWKVHSDLLLVIDEASMINQNLKDLIDEATDQSCKIIYVGDHLQLAPVKEELSKVYSEHKRHSILVEPMRNAEQPDLIKLCSRVRTVVETLDFSPIYQFQSVPGVIDVMDDDEAGAFISSHFLDEDVNARILAYSNARVNQYNAFLRSLRGYPDKFTKGERLVAAKSMAITNKTMMQVEEQLHVIEDLGPDVFIVDGNDANSHIAVQNLHVRTDRFEAHIKVASDPAHAEKLKKHYFKQKDWKKAYSIEENIADLRPSTSCTVHKSQGSTYDTVFIDLTNIGKCTHTNELARMLYVAVTRARSRIVIHGALPARLFV